MPDYKLLYEELARNIDVVLTLLDEFDWTKYVLAVELLEDTIYSAKFLENRKTEHELFKHSKVMKNKLPENNYELENIGEEI